MIINHINKYLINLFSDITNGLNNRRYPKGALFLFITFQMSKLSMFCY